jgi:hypothetical protein
MACLPINGVREPVSITNAAGLEVGIVPGVPNRLAVDAIVAFVPPPPGTTVLTNPDTAVPAVPAVAVLLPAPAAGTTRVRYMNTKRGTEIRIREAGGPIGSGMIMLYTGQQEYGAEGGSIAAMEVEWISGLASAVAMQEEGP